jgi:hypothetical protein
VGDLSLKGRVGVLADSELDSTTANGVAFRVGVNANSTGATVQRTDCPPFSMILRIFVCFAFKTDFSMLGHLIW